MFPNGTFYCGKFRLASVIFRICQLESVTVLRYNKPYGKGVWVFKNGNQLAGDYLQKACGLHRAGATPPNRLVALGRCLYGRKHIWNNMTVPQFWQFPDAASAMVCSA